MQINLTNVGKRYNREWIFRKVNHSFSSGKKYAVTGPNGSGKSTLLQVIAGAVTHNEGQIQYLLNSKPIEEENFFKHISIATPYLELIEEMTAKEMLEFHAQFKPLSGKIEEMLEVIGLTKAANKQIRYFSSGMKQRLKLAQAFFADAPVLMLDEPTTNLDAEGVALYLRLIKEYSGNKLVLISSNDLQEYSFCDEVINVIDYK